MGQQTTTSEMFVKRDARDDKGWDVAQVGVLQWVLGAVMPGIAGALLVRVLRSA